MKRIAVLASGGDAPGMNACIRAVVRSALHHGLSASGVLHGYRGLIEGEFREFSTGDVSNIIQRGGSILFSARSETFQTVEGRAEAARNLRDRSIDGLIVIGGNGSFRGADAIAREQGIAVVGVPATIDNDVWGTDYTIGYDTAVNTALDSVDRIKDTAASHERVFIVEVMGRSAGFIALEVGVGSGAEAILLPETPTDVSALAALITERILNGRRSSIIICAEGDENGGARAVASELKTVHGIDSQVTVLGHVQRGGSPTTSDRVLASKLGWAAVDALCSGAAPCMVGEVSRRIVRHPLADSWTFVKEIDTELVKLAPLI